MKSDPRWASDVSVVAAWLPFRLLPSARHLLSEANRISERAGEFVSVEVERVED